MKYTRFSTNVSKDLAINLVTTQLIIKVLYKYNDIVI